MNSNLRKEHERIKSRLDELTKKYDEQETLDVKDIKEVIFDLVDFAVARFEGEED